MKEAMLIIAMLVAYGIVGTMDMEDEIVSREPVKEQGYDH